MAAVRRLEKRKMLYLGSHMSRKTNEVSFPTNYGITITLEWLFYSFGYSLASKSNSGGASYRAKGLKPPTPIFAPDPPEFLCKVIHCFKE